MPPFCLRIGELRALTWEDYDAENDTIFIWHEIEEAGIRYLSSHKIRFFGATVLFNAGVDPEQIRRIMGHTNIAMTEHYNRTDGKINVDPEIWKKIFDKPEN